MRDELLGRVHQGHGRARSGLAIVAGVFLLLRRDFMCQMENARMLEKSVEELQRKVYDDGRSAEADIADILELTSSGLSDGLTGTVTRSVFSSKLASALENARDCNAVTAARSPSSTSTTSRRSTTRMAMRPATRL